MSGELTITFATDMPAVAVDVVSPELQVVDRLMMRGGQVKTVAVPSEASFLRVHLPSGRIVTLSDPGNLNRTVTKESLFVGSSRGESVAPQPSLPNIQQRERLSVQDLSSRRDIRRHHLWRAVTDVVPEFSDETLPLGSYGKASLRESSNHGIPGTATAQSREARWQISGALNQPPLEFRVEQPDLATVTVRIPGNVSLIWARADRLSRERSLTYSIRAQSNEPVADTILNYLRRGDLNAAESMAEWAGQSTVLLADKMDDPYGAAVGAYLLLRLRQFNLLHNCAHNLADSFGFMSDGCVIWAWQLIHQEPDRTTEIRDYLLKAVERGLPVYSEGVRLLLDGLQLLGSEGEAAHKKLRSQTGTILWESPLTARVAATRESRAAISPDYVITYDIGFGAPA